MDGPTSVPSLAAQGIALNGSGRQQTATNGTAFLGFLCFRR
jgi:hypothetical protein